MAVVKRKSSSASFSNWQTCNANRQGKVRSSASIREMSLPVEIDMPLFKDFAIPIEKLFTTTLSRGSEISLNAFRVLSVEPSSMTINSDWRGMEARVERVASAMCFSPFRTGKRTERVIQEVSQSNSSSLLLRGGLGNILFQLAAGLRAKRALGSEVAIISNFSEVALRETDVRELVDYVASQCNLQIETSRKIPHSAYLGGSLLRGLTLVKDGNVKKWLTGATEAKAVTLSGYFQSWPVFQTELAHVAGLAREYMARRLPSPVGNSGSIHLRLGDYLKHKHIYGELSSHYIENSLSRVASLADSTLNQIRVFTNDEEAAQVLLDKIGQSFSYELMSPRSAVEDLWQLSQSTWVVGANSTFSWWGAAIGNFRPLTLPKPFLIKPSMNSKIDLGSPNVMWIDREGEDDNRG